MNNALSKLIMYVNVNMDRNRIGNLIQDSGHIRPRRKHNTGRKHVDEKRGRHMEDHDTRGGAAQSQM